MDKALIKGMQEYLNDRLVINMLTVDKLNIKQIRFVIEFLSNGLNQTRAYLKVYCNNDRSKYQVAKSGASRLIKKDKIKAGIKRGLDVMFCFSLHE